MILQVHAGMNTENLLGIVAGTFTSAALLPQLIKTFKEKKAEDLSMGMLFCLLIGVGLWIWYGFMKKDMPIIITNCFSFLVNSCLIILGLIYKKQRN